MIYFDNAATTYPKPEAVYRQMEQALRQAVNIGRGSYEQARQGAVMADGVRSKLLSLCHGTESYRVILSPSATVAANQVLQGLDYGSVRRIYLTPYEHNAIVRTAAAMSRKYDAEICLVPVLKNGAIDLEQLAYAFVQAPPDILCCTMVSNVTGYVLPVQEMIQAAQEAGAKVILDGAQAVGLLPVDLERLSPEYLIFAGHKTLYGSFGIGGFFMKRQEQLSPMLYGGNGIDSLNISMNQPGSGRYEPGSPDYIALASLSAALDWLEQTGISSLFFHEQYLIKMLAERLSQIPGVTLYPAPDVQTGILAFSIEGYTPEEAGCILDEEFQIAVRTGYHCAPYVHDVIGTREQKGCIRVSVGAFTAEKEIDCLVEAVRNIAEE